MCGFGWDVWGGGGGGRGVGGGAGGFSSKYQVGESFVHHVQDNIRVILKVTLCLIPSLTP